eukprot:TRINITY_DN9014_c0_g1_i1.p1 TRINITY_DN9014_c0_g1~~TRINITY_DN9014_c0_g1_i1.p1  ORF type:complete len:362 (-),score=88.60 TRINITY_DN9014_c0_g1_i1:343-1428(-)
MSMMLSGFQPIYAQDENKVPARAKRYGDQSRQAEKRPALGDISNGARGGATKAPTQQLAQICLDSHDDIPPMTPEAEPMAIDAVQIRDIDAPDMYDPLHCTVYAEDIMTFLFERERTTRAFPRYMDCQKDVNASMRAILMDWLVEVQEEYKLQAETLYLAHNFVDRFLSIENVPRTKLQLVGVTCMLVATKFEEIFPPAVDEFVYITDNTYSREEVLSMECAVLDKLAFELTIATPNVFLKRFLKAAGGDARTNHLAAYIMELTLVDYDMLQYLPSTTAAAAVSIALHTMGMAAWSPTLTHYARIEWESDVLQRCIRDMFTLFENVHAQKLEAVREKYSHKKYERVSGIHAPFTRPQYTAY